MSSGRGPAGGEGGAVLSLPSHGLSLPQEPFVTWLNYDVSLSLQASMAASAQLPVGSSAIQIMENFLCPLKSAIGTWQGCSPCLVNDAILSIVRGVLLFLVLVHCSWRDGPSSPRREHRNTRKVRIPWPRLKGDDPFCVLIPTF